MTALLTIHNLSKTFENGTAALEAVELSVAAGQVTTLLGASGCGKSTLLKIVAGLLPMSAGHIDWAETPARGDIGFVFQEPTLLPWATVQDNISLPFTLSGNMAADAAMRVREVIDLVGLSGFERAYPRELSGGMKMRVSLARALVSKPKVLLMDEPFAALDEITRAKLNTDLLQICAQENVTVLFVTHSVQESVFLSDTIFVMKPRPGRVFAHFALSHESQRDEAYRLSPEFGDKVREASLSLKASMEAAP
ncbi:MAG: ABC transporter ATP-binding protein [Alphaproteobacteria bacterium]|nr:MAG: ABC transporter ATP-binding protein [Alphaproteobacteria bacterium]